MKNVSKGTDNSALVMERITIRLSGTLEFIDRQFGDDGVTWSAGKSILLDFLETIEKSNTLIMNSILNSDIAPDTSAEPTLLRKIHQTQNAVNSLESEVGKLEPSEMDELIPTINNSLKEMVDNQEKTPILYIVNFVEKSSDLILHNIQEKITELTEGRDDLLSSRRGVKPERKTDRLSKEDREEIEQDAKWKDKVSTTKSEKGGGHMAK
ncbi:hypothetical protein Cyrtocomes_00500 [Candidatus Cyrtobacter comes]|uniref:Uncharacterized protein n=1 Tax=Candidatus Cyrtobacter comes TaxID=675776 RepID=A0ABU5L7M8_9RICK|nr:hypothetical protein [Candidatus Cyrtobacter comes]MDZ5762131.1 hypothetical protein [Candidatus Cyrtobacter comes]